MVGRFIGVDGRVVWNALRGGNFTDQDMTLTLYFKLTCSKDTPCNALAIDRKLKQYNTDFNRYNLL